MSPGNFEMILKYLAAITLPPQEVEIIMRNLNSTTKLGLWNPTSKMLLFSPIHLRTQDPTFPWSWWARQSPCQAAPPSLESASSWSRPARTSLAASRNLAEPISVRVSPSSETITYWNPLFQKTVMGSRFLNREGLLLQIRILGDFAVVVTLHPLCPQNHSFFSRFLACHVWNYFSW